MNPSPYYQAPSTLHGQGLYASIDLQPGRRILEERVAWHVSSKTLKSDTQLLVSFRTLRPKDRDSILILSGGFIDATIGNKTLNTSTKKEAAKRLREILDRNAQMDDDGMTMYKTIARVNHSCVPNSELNESADNKLIYLIASIAIKKDEELTINYHEPFAPTRHRADFLQRIYRIPQCGCPLCNLPAAARQRSDQRRIEILKYLNCLNEAYQNAKNARLRRQVPEAMFVTMAKGVLVMIEKLERLVQEEDIQGGPLLVVYSPAFHAAEGIKERKLARQYARRLVEVGALLGLERLVPGRAVLMAGEEEEEDEHGEEADGEDQEEISLDGAGNEEDESEEEEDEHEDVDSEDDDDDDDNDDDVQAPSMEAMTHKMAEIKLALSNLGVRQPE